MTGTWDSFAKRLSAAPTAGRGAHPAAVDAWTEALTLAGGADSCDIKSLVQKRDAPGKAETALQSKAQQRRLQHAMIGNAVAGFGKVQILTSEAELELESDGEVDEEYAWTSRGPFAARMYCSLAKELWCCGRRRRARAAAQGAVSVNPWCFEAISLLDQWNPRRVRRSSSARSIQALQQGHAATSLTPTSSFGAALSGPLRPWLRRAMRDEEAVIVRLQALFRQKKALTRAIETRTSLHHMLAELQLCVEAATAIQICFRLWIWKDVVRWYFRSAVHLAAACITRTIRRKSVSNMATRAARIRKEVVQIELEFLRLGRVGWGRKMEEATLAKGRLLLLKQLEEEQAAAEAAQRKLEEAQRGAVAASGKFVARARERYDDEGHLMHPDEMRKKRTKVCEQLAPLPP